VKLRLLCLFFLATGAASSVELHLQFGALERMLAQQVFTQDGRRYVHNDNTNKCNFAYLEKPQVRGVEGKLNIHARFTGRSALNMFGQCVGLGDAFDLTIAATPQFRDGYIALGSVRVTSDNKSGYYIRRVCPALASSLGRDFRYPISAEFQKALEDAAILPLYPRRLQNFRVIEIRVTVDALVLVLDFELTVK
jgi:hypothetical protein